MPSDQSNRDAGVAAVYGGTEEPTLENGGLGEGIVEPEAPAAPPEQLTRKQIGQLRRQYFTKVHGTVKACGHKAKFAKDKDPGNNCAQCWAAYFATSVALEFIHTVLTTKGVKALIAMKGTKFTKAFHGWLASCMLPALAKEIKETPVHTEGSVFDAASQS